MQQNNLSIGMPTPPDSAAALAAAQTLVKLCTGVLPVWVRQLAASRAQSETAVSEMMQAFSTLGPHLELAQRQSTDITAALSQGDGTITGLTQACECALAPLRQHVGLPEGGAAAIDTALALVRAAVGAIEQINQPFSAETHAVAAQVERMYIGFQYQDRISQMIALLESDMARLLRALDGSGTDIPDLAAWLSGLEAQYAMAEQRQNHAAAPGAELEADKETTFF
jgi:hypothetical protein